MPFQPVLLSGYLILLQLCHLHNYICVALIIPSLYQIEHSMGNLYQNMDIDLLQYKESTCQCRRHKRCGCDTWVGKISWRRKQQPTPVFLSGEFHEQGSLVGYSPQGHRESDTAEHTSISTSYLLALKTSETNLISHAPLQVMFFNLMDDELFIYSYISTIQL